MYDTRDAATRSTGRQPVAFGTIVGWSRATMQRGFAEAAARMKSTASENEAVRGF
jgi:hypothetical protein